MKRNLKVLTSVFLMSLMLVAFVGQSFAESYSDDTSMYINGITFNTVEEKEDYEKIEIVLPDGSKEYIIERGNESEGVTIEAINKDGESSFIRETGKEEASIFNENGDKIETVNANSEITLEPIKDNSVLSSSFDVKASRYSYPTNWVYLKTYYGNIKSDYDDISYIIGLIATICQLPIRAAIVQQIASKAYISNLPNTYYKKVKHSRLTSPRSVEYRTKSYFYKYSNYTGYIGRATSYKGWGY